MESSIVPFLIWIICLGLAAGLIIYALKISVNDPENEGFAMNIQMTSCPPSTASYITKDGDTNCCDGDIVSKQCNGNNICSLSPQRPGGLPSCSSWMNKSWGDRATRFCPSSMPHYYGPIDRKQGGSEGCSSSQANSDGSAPQDPSKPTCNIYSNEADELAQIDSCLNRKALDAMDAPGAKSIVRTKNMALLTASAVPADGSSLVPVLCYDFARMAQYLKATQPDIGDRFAKDPCGTLPGTLICGMNCKSANKADLPGTVVPKKGQTIGSVQISENYNLSFDITPKSVKKDWGSILHFNSGGKDCCDLGNRSPALWFVPGSLNLHVRIGDSKDGNWGFDSVPGCSMNQRIHISLECSGSVVKLTIGSNSTTLAQPNKRFSGPGTVYSGDPFYESADALIENLSYTSL